MLNFNQSELYFSACLHENARVVFFRYKSGKPRFREFCDDCGNFTEHGYPGCGLERAIAKYSRDRVWAAQSGDEVSLRPKYPIYQEYIQSSAWFSKRAEVMLRADGYCEVEGCSNRADQVHHLHYQSLGAEALTDLVAVCKTCHERIHSDA